MEEAKGALAPGATMGTCLQWTTAGPPQGAVDGAGASAEAATSS
jgi:hypothetical protein